MEYLQMDQMLAEKNSPLFYVIILLLSMLDVSSGVIYNKGNMDQHFTCVTDRFLPSVDIIKLYLSTGFLKIQCIFLSETPASSVSSLNMFTSGGLAPSLIITNSTYTGIFHFNLTLFSDQIYWLIDIPRENITRNTDIASVEEWWVRISLKYGLDIYTTEGTLLDTVREPILQTNVGAEMTLEEITEIYSSVKALKVTKSPCANDVALIGYILNLNHSGIYVGLTTSGFWNSQETKWYNLTDAIYIGYEHEHLTLVDMVLTNMHLILLASTGLFVTNLYQPMYPWLKADFIKGKLWYTERCLANREKFEVDYVSITFDRNKTLSEKQTSATVNTFKYNSLSITTKFPTFIFPRSFSKPLGMVFHPRSHFLYAYGNQIWLSMDGGNTFELIASFYYEYIKETSHSFYTSDIVFISDRGNIYRTKAGLSIYEKFGIVREKAFALYYDHMGFLHKLTPNVLEGIDSNVDNVFKQNPDQSFHTALAPQLLTFREIIFFAYVPLNESLWNVHKRKFSGIHKGKVISYSKIGSAYIKKILYHDTPAGFLSSVIAEIIEPFGVEKEDESSCLYSSLSITPTNYPFYVLTLTSQDPNVVSLFQKTDVEKTVVIVGYSSFLITKIVNNTNALALATMPSIVPRNMTFRSDSWFLYDFGLLNRRKWSIHSKRCNYWLQPLDDSLTLSLQKYIDLGESYTFKIKIIPTLRDPEHFESPQLKIIAGNAHLFHIQSKHSFDDTDNYMLEVTVTSRSLDLGFISLAFVIWDASTNCVVTTVIPTLKSSCSYVKAMHHVPYIHIPKEDWIKGVRKDSQGFNLIKTLPVNYRPPSNMGIAIPLTNNFYHADPSKPIPRNLFPESRKRGQFKQCAGASNREQCHCTDNDKYSYAVAVSDCREKNHPPWELMDTTNHEDDNEFSIDIYPRGFVLQVPRFKFPVTNYPITLEIHDENGNIPVARPYLVTVSEVNQRGNWKLKYSVPSDIKKLKEYSEFLFQVPVYNPVGLNLSIEGSELFHFRVSVVEGISFCELTEEFQIYVDEVPLPFPGHTLIAVAAAVLLGGLIIIAFMLQICNIHPCDLVQKLIQKRGIYHPKFHGKNAHK